MAQLKHFFRNYWQFLVLGAITIASFFYRVINLNYNSPFNDEAIYVVLGRMGIFQGDWWTYNAASWMAGQPYIYPSMSALSYMIGGIVGSRLLNVVFGALFVEAMYVFTVYITPGSKKEKTISGLISAFFIAFSSVGFYLSRLATYDLPSFYFFILSLVFLLRGFEMKEYHGKWYFSGAFFLFLAFATKIIIGFYVPFILVLSFILAKKAGKVNMHFWLTYFLLPFFLLIGLYVGFNLKSLYAYAHSQSGREYAQAAKILYTYWENTSYAWYVWAIASIGLLIKKEWRIWVLLTAVASFILITHIGLHRWSTFDKHTFLSIMFLAPLIGIGFTRLVFFPKRYYMKVAMLGLTLSVLEIYTIYSIIDSQRFNKLWDNSNPVLAYLSEKTESGDRILVEVGAGAILANYDKNYPPYTTTFDWFEYKGKQGQEAYLAALKDGYFDLVELDGGDQTLETIHSSMHNAVLANIEGNYSLVYNEGGYLVYERTF